MIVHHWPSCTGSCLRVQYCLDCKNILTVLIGLLCHLDCHGRGTLLRELYVVLFIFAVDFKFRFALNPQYCFVFWIFCHISSRETVWKFVFPKYVKYLIFFYYLCPTVRLCLVIQEMMTRAPIGGPYSFCAGSPASGKIRENSWICGFQTMAFAAALT